MLTPVEDDGESSCSEMLEAEATEDEKNFEKLKGAVGTRLPAIVHLPKYTFKVSLS